MREFPVIAIRSVEFGVPDLARAEAFYREVWGLGVSGRNQSTLYLRATGGDHHVLALRRHPSAEILSVSFRTNDVNTLNRVTERVVAAGGRVLSSAAPNPEPDGGVVLKVASPEGFILRFHADDTLSRDEKTRQAFPFRLSHINLNCRDVEASSRFFQQALGFAETDRSRAMSFLSCNSDHHAVVLADSGVDGLNHVAFMMPEWESVMLGSGRMIDHGFPIGWGVGRHGPGNNVFAYFVDPFGFVIEYTAEVLQVNKDYQPHGPDYWVWPPGRTDQWGIAPPKTEAVKQAQIAIRFATPERGAATHG